MSAILCAVDVSSNAGRVVYHAAGLAAVLGEGLRVMHVTERGSTADADQRLRALVERAIPYEVPIGHVDFLARSGDPADEILHEASSPNVTMVVMGTRALGWLARRIIGSTSETVLRRSLKAVLLVPPTEMDIVVVSAGHSLLNCGPVLVAVDLSHSSHAQVVMASHLARIAGQPLVLLSVASGDAEHEATVGQLRALADDAHVTPAGFIVRIGDIADEIAACAAAEGAGLVVMGLNESRAGQAGAMAARVLHRGGAFVLAVPELADVPARATATRADRARVVRKEPL